MKKNVELAYLECYHIISALKLKRKELEKTIKRWSDIAESAVEEKSDYKSIVRYLLEELDEVNQIIDKLNHKLKEC